ncbi:MAG: hypothetical protein IKK34_07235 [Clostridia bacterium]|nr:hypothetical protein [Clostridia bacterium]
MRTDLLGLPLEDALCALRSEGIGPDVTITNAPRRANETRGMLRVVFASDDGRRVTAARFLDPIEEANEDKG